MKTKMILSIALISSTTALLGGCAAALVGGGAAGGYYVSKDKGAIGQYADDAVITSKVKAKYLKDLTLKAFSISVSTIHGIVNLTGAVPTEKLRQKAVYIALHTKGVKAVDARNLLVTPAAAKTN